MLKTVGINNHDDLSSFREGMLRNQIIEFSFDEWNGLFAYSCIDIKQQFFQFALPCGNT